MPSSRDKHKIHKPSLFARFLTLLPASCVLFYPLYLANQLDTKAEDYISAALPKEFDGLTITYLSDIHYGSLFNEARVRKLTEKVNALNSDLILLGGDYAEDSQGAVEFWSLKPAFRANLGVFAIMGNHDRTTPERNLTKIADLMREDLVVPLVNDVWMLKKDQSSLAIAGLDDYYNGRPDFKSAAKKTKDADFTLLLTHTPDQIPDILNRGNPFFNLALCGHTHGGQVTVFGHALHSSSIYGSKYLSGWFHEGGTDFMVSNGVGTSWLPVRLGARPQIHKITLRSHSSPAIDSENAVSHEAK